MSNVSDLRRTQGGEEPARGRRHVFMTLSRTDDFIEGALNLGESLRATGFRCELLVALGRNVSATSELQIESAGHRTLRLFRHSARPLT